MLVPRALPVQRATQARKGLPEFQAPRVSKALRVRDSISNHP